MPILYLTMPYMYICMNITNTKGTYLQGEPSSAWL